MNDIRRVLRTFWEEVEVCETNGEREQLITKVVKDIQECRFCSFEKEQHDINEETNEPSNQGETSASNQGETNGRDEMDDVLE